MSKAVVTGGDPEAAFHSALFSDAAPQTREIFVKARFFFLGGFCVLNEPTRDTSPHPCCAGNIKLYPLQSDFSLWQCDLIEAFDGH